MGKAIPANGVAVIYRNSSSALGQALEKLLQLDIPAKGRIAHHIRNGRLQIALTLCARGKVHLWQQMWSRYTVKPVLEQLHQLRQLERLLLSESKSASGYGLAFDI